MRHLVGGGGGGGGGGEGGELAKEVAFAFIFLLLFCGSHFVMFSGLLIFLFVKLLYYTTYFVQKLHPFFFFLCFA